MLMRFSTQACGSNKEKNENKIPLRQRIYRSQVLFIYLFD